MNLKKVVMASAGKALETAGKKERNSGEASVCPFFIYQPQRPLRPEDSHKAEGK